MTVVLATDAHIDVEFQGDSTLFDKTSASILEMV